LLAVAVIAATTSCSSDGPVKQLMVAAASDLKPVLDPIAAQYETDTGVKVVITYGSSGQLATQITQGAPVDLFFSADRAKATAAAGDSATPLTTYALARLAVWVGTGTAPDITGLTDPRFAHIAIANPDHAPYGQAAREALTAAGIYEAIADRLVLGENVADTLRLATTGNADAAVVALSLAKTAGGSFSEVPAELLTPLEQTAVVLTTEARAQQWATDLLARFTSDTGRAMLADAGFGLPG
jgi:molybdate transport system substrate-binding protein